MPFLGVEKPSEERQVPDEADALEQTEDELSLGVVDAQEDSENDG